VSAVDDVAVPVSRGAHGGRPAASNARENISARVRDSAHAWAGPASITAVALWLCHRFFFSSALPAGTDMFDLLARAQANANWTTLFSPWSPSGLGAPRQTSLDNLLGLLVMLTGSPARTVELLIVALLLISGLSTYWVARQWWGSRLGAAIAGLLYMTSQAELGRIASGWLHYSALVALTPLLIYLWVSLLDRYSLRRALIFALLASAVVFARQDMILWLVPALLLYIPIRLMTSQPGSRPARQIILTIATAVPTVLALSLYLIIPLAGGIHAAWLSTNELFEQIRFNLVDRSLTAYQSLLGLGRDLGYLPFNREPWWDFHPWFPLPFYYALQTLIVLAAFAAVCFRRDRKTKYLVLCALVAAILGKGIRGPVGEPYWWAVQHVPIFGNLRGPNRWLIPQAFAYAALAGSTVVVLRGRLSRASLSVPMQRVSNLAFGAGCLLLLLPVGPMLLSGFRTWAPPKSSVALMKTISSDHSSASVGSVPWDQSMMYVKTSGYQGWEHDLGVESSLYTNHPALSTNSWDRRSSDFVDFTSGLLARRDRAFTALLGSIGTKYELAFNYPSESELAGRVPRRLRQRRDLAALPKLTPVAKTSTGSVYRLSGVAPLLSLRTNIVTVLGGRSGLAAFADLPGVNISNWAAYTADDLLTGSESFSRLLALMRTSDVIFVAGASLNDLAVLASKSVARVPGITSDPGSDRKYGLLLTDESARQGSLSDQSIAPAGLVSTATRTFSLAEPQSLELWARVLSSGTAGRLSFSLDGQVVRTLLPLDAGRGAFEWVHIKTARLAAGTHTLSVSGHRSLYGGTFEVDEARLIRPIERRDYLRTLQRELKVYRRKVAYSVSLSSGPFANTGGVVLGHQNKPFWQPWGHKLQAHEVARHSGEGLQLRFFGRRQFYTVAQHTFRIPQSWTSHRLLEFPYRGTGSGASYSLLVDFDRDNARFASTRLTDVRTGWQTATLPLQPGGGNWSHITSIRVSTQSRAGAGSIELGRPRLLLPEHLVKRIELPTVPVRIPQLAPGVAGSRPHIGMEAHAHSITAVIPLRAALGGAALSISPAIRVPNRPALPVHFRRMGGARYTYSVRSQRRGVLVFNQAYDSHWAASDDGAPAQSDGPVTSLVNGFTLGPGQHSGSVFFRNGSLVRLGALLSLAALLLVLSVVAVLTLRRKQTEREGDLQSEASIEPAGLTTSDAEFSILVAGAVLASAPFSFAAALGIVAVCLLTRRAGWTRAAIVGCALVVAAPVEIAIHRYAAADRIAVAAIFAFLIALARLAVTTQRARA
jgi:hypothetical protein